MFNFLRIKQFLIRQNSAIGYLRSGKWIDDIREFAGSGFIRDWLL